MTILTAWPISGPPVLKLLSALASDVRFELVQILAHGEHRVCDLEAVLNMPQSKVSYHLATLRAVWSAANSAARTAIIDWNAGDYTLGGDLLQALLIPDPGLTRRIKSVC